MFTYAPAASVRPAVDDGSAGGGASVARESSRASPSAAGAAADDGASTAAAAAAAAASAQLPVSLRQLTTPLPASLRHNAATAELLALLRILYLLNEHHAQLYGDDLIESASAVPAFRIPDAEFVNQQITMKLIRQLRDPLALCGSMLPDWCWDLVRTCPFLFSSESRQLFLQCTAFGITRALMRLQEQVADAQSLSELPDRLPSLRLTRSKVRIRRSQILQSAMETMRLHAGDKSVLEVEFTDEVGTGLGPTLEFYSLASRALQRAELDLWRRGDEAMDADTPVSAGEAGMYVRSSRGLFPAPMRASASDNAVQLRLRLFNTLGRLCGRALLDSRRLDLPLSPAALRWILGQAEQLGLADMEDVDPHLAQSLRKLAELGMRRRAIGRDAGLTAEERACAVQALRLDGQRVEDLCLDFSLPGYPDYELVEGGRGRTVTVETVDEYVQLVVEHTLRIGVRRQFDALLSGLSMALDPSALQIFSPDELNLLICGVPYEPWTVRLLAEVCKPDHGYSSGSRVIADLFALLSEFDPAQQRRFLKFVTGSPTLPVGGLAMLRPPMTIVRKPADPPLTADDYLPSVMTCANYLKLPEYSSCEVLRARLLRAMDEGQESFHLS